MGDRVDPVDRRGDALVVVCDDESLGIIEVLVIEDVAGARGRLVPALRPRDPLDRTERFRALELGTDVPRGATDRVRDDLPVHRGLA